MPPAPGTRGRRWRAGLSLRLLALTIVFVMSVQLLVLVPTVANFRKTWLEDRLAAAQVAVMVLEAAPREGLPPGLEAQLLDGVGALAIAARAGGVRRLLAQENLPSEVGRTTDLREPDSMGLLTDAFDVLINGAHPRIRVVGRSMGEADFVEIVIDERPLRQAMLAFSRNLVVISFVIAAISAALVYLALHWIIVRPVKRLARNVTGFAAEPENPTRRIAASTRSDEIGDAERALADMEETLARALHERRRLAAVGLAVSKINHDLRNMLASAQLVSDRISTVNDPSVQRFAPKLIGTLNRAIDFCQSTLAYGRVIEPPPQLQPVALAALVEDVADLLGLGPQSTPRFDNRVPAELRIDADPEQMIRVLSNLMRNAVQALAGPLPEGRTAAIIVSAERVDPARDAAAAANGPGHSPAHATADASAHQPAIDLRIADTGPGVPARARAALFEAFKGSVTAGGTGLGLAIAAELVAAHGGSIVLEDSEIGAVFRIRLPARSAM